jgi:hypothetical protein
VQHHVADGLDTFDCGGASRICCKGAGGPGWVGNRINATSVAACLGELKTWQRAWPLRLVRTHQRSGVTCLRPNRLSALVQLFALASFPPVEAGSGRVLFVCRKRCVGLGGGVQKRCSRSTRAVVLFGK